MKPTAALQFLLVIHPLLGQPTEVFRNPTAGFEITKPASWHYASAQENAENLKAAKLNDQEFQAAMSKYATTPMVIITKFKEPYPDLNPSLKVNIRPLGPLKGRAPSDIVKLIVPQLERVFKDFQIGQPPTEVVISGLAASYVRINYTLQTSNGDSFPTTSELWIVPRGDFFFMIGAGTRQDEKTGSRKEIDAMINSIKIDP